jgi:hypothetical protein
VTTLATENDGGWKGMPTLVDEYWVSDGLGVTMLEIHTTLRNKNESRSILTQIKRQEPDAALFEIPPDYKINPPPEKKPSSYRKCSIRANPATEQVFWHQ